MAVTKIKIFQLIEFIFQLFFQNTTGLSAIELHKSLYQEQVGIFLYNVRYLSKAFSNTGTLKLFCWVAALPGK